MPRFFESEQIQDFLSIRDAEPKIFKIVLVFLRIDLCFISLLTDNKYLRFSRLPQAGTENSFEKTTIQVLDRL